MKTNRLQILSNSIGTSQIMCELWWDGKEVKTDNPSYLKRLNKYSPGNTTSKSGLKFLENVSMFVRSGYTSCRSLPDEE